MDTAQWSQEIGEEMISNTCPRPTTTILGVGGGGGEKKARPQKEQAINCPRCNSTNTKFCYYNNYSLTQPRYFCKTCRRYWTEGGSLRNVPVGGGSRKNKRSSNSSTSSSSSSSSKKFLPADLTTTQPSCTTTATSQTSFHLQNPKIIEGQDLNLAFPITQDYHHHHNISEFVELPNLENNKNNTKNNLFPISTSSSPSSHLSALEFLRNTTSGITSRGGLSGFMPMGNPDTNMVFSSGFALQDFKPTLNFGLDGVGNGGYGGIQGDTTCTNTTSGRISSFPFEDLRQGSNTSTTSEFEQNKGDTNGYWSGMLGGGSW